MAETLLGCGSTRLLLNNGGLGNGGVSKWIRAEALKNIDQLVPERLKRLEDANLVVLQCSSGHQQCLLAFQQLVATYC